MPMAIALMACAVVHAEAFLSMPFPRSSPARPRSACARSLYMSSKTQAGARRALVAPQRVEEVQLGQQALEGRLHTARREADAAMEAARRQHRAALEIAAAAGQVPEILCRYGARCYRPDCLFKHPPGRVAQAPACRDGWHCTRKDCGFTHPPGVHDTVRLPVELRRHGLWSARSQRSPALLRPGSR